MIYLAECAAPTSGWPLALIIASICAMFAFIAWCETR